MRSLAYWMLALVGPALLLSGCGSSAPPSADSRPAAVTRPAQLDTATTQMSQQGLYRISFTAEEEPITISTLQTWTVQVATPDGQPVEGAAVTITGGMPEHNHGLPTAPLVTPSGGGVYRVEGMKFQMPGWWTVTVTVAAGGQQDSATFNLLLN